MSRKPKEETALAASPAYRFPSHLVDAESQGPAYDAFRSYPKSNSASAFSEQTEGYPVMNEISDGFAAIAGKAIASMKKPTSTK
ncbi:hypothetical protein [Azospirillum sp. TSO22-1]|uniref:hypothetical protein n=1 Tax=Azospirillum sp. TSO22-1 TaxID=716789 RepID=UPI0011B6AE8D|nr:hypothetical protein [Azospirillum sp. TSO22-1]